MFKLVVLFSIVACALGASIPSGLLPQLDGRIVGGDEANIESFPYTVSLQRSNSHSCGGSIITKTKILTAAHCVYGAATNNLNIRAGSTSWSSGGVSIKVASVDINPNYNPNTMVNDVAILTLESPLTLTGNIAKIGLIDATPAAGADAVVDGWGTVRYGNSNIPTNLRSVEVQIVSNEVCNKQYSGSILTTMLCASAEGKDACQGDSGGPLAVGGLLAGVVSWGYGCAEPKYAGVYANVADLKDWINKNSE